MYNKVISVTASISAHELPSEGSAETTFPMVEAALGEGYSVKEVISHQNGAIVNHLFILETPSAEPGRDMSKRV